MMNLGLNIIDKRKTILKHPTKKPRLRKTSDITSIAIHHSLTNGGNSDAFAKTHINTNNWSSMGYPLVILQNGDVEWCYDFNVITPHVGDSNKKAIGICLVGDFTKYKPKDVQIKTLFILLDYLTTSIPSIKEIKGHSEYPGYSWKKCPAIDMNKLRLDYKNRGGENMADKNKPPIKIPQYKSDAIDYLASNGILGNPELWKGKADEPMPVWAVCVTLMNLHKELNHK